VDPQVGHEAMRLVELVGRARRQVLAAKHLDLAPPDRPPLRCIAALVAGHPVLVGPGVEEQLDRLGHRLGPRWRQPAEEPHEDPVVEGDVLQAADQRRPSRPVHAVGLVDAHRRQRPGEHDRGAGGDRQPGLAQHPHEPDGRRELGRRG
jgi:hypothetical protein